MAETPFDEWLHALLSRASDSRIASQVARVMAQQPERTSYASTAELAQLAGVNAAGVTRSAQALGFSGWPALREELRARYLTSLSMSEIASRHAGVGAATAAERSHQADQRALASSAALLRDPALHDIAEMLATARSRLAIGTGSYSTVVQLLAINATLAGYPTTTLSEGSTLANGIARIGPGDVVVIVSFWRIGWASLHAARYARKVGATVCVVTDHAPSPLTEAAHHVLKVTAEGGAHFPSMVPAVAVVNGICAELAAIDPARTRASIEVAEAAWDDMESFVDGRA
jgi:DNA-binding MurR/RpiR family transcriptional regulator